MIVRVDLGAGTVDLEEASAFDGFKVVAVGGPAEGGLIEAAVAAVLGDDGRVAGPGHVWVRAEAVGVWAGEAADAPWRAGFAKMLDYAWTKGWTDESAAFVQAHVETIVGTDDESA